MNATIRQGDIVRVTIYDPNGKNPKNRRAVVVTKSDEIHDDGLVVVAAISTKFDPKNIPGDCVAIPWQRSVHPRTSLTEPSVVKCNWLKTVPCCEVTKVGHLCGQYLLDVIRVIATLARE